MASGEQAVCVDGSLAQLGGWTSDLAQSGLAAFHVTTARNLIGFEDIVSRTLAARIRVRENAEHMYLVETIEDLDRIGDGGEERVGVILGAQNAACLAGDPSKAALLRELGLRILQPTYNFANGVADGCLEERDAGLSRHGKLAVRECDRAGLLLDISHLGTRSSLDVIHSSNGPVVATHANRRAVVPIPRNKEDVVLRELAAAGGVVGISPYGPMAWKGDPASRPTIADFVDHVLDAIELLGEDAVAIGTALPGSMDPSSDDLLADSLKRWPARYPEILGRYVEAFGNLPETRSTIGFESVAAWRDVPGWLAGAGLSAETCAKVLGGNWLRVYRAAWVSR